ncbi:MAG: molecular chaperone HtpG, partial [Lachnospiraceae bacterium]|nr:molecular chaperone HtpG [Lachnospiraceae bacterium]
KLAGLCKTDRENYNKYWEDISPFIKYGCLKDDKFCEKMNDYILFRNLEGDYITLPDALKISDEEKKAETAEGENGEKVEAEVVDEGTEKSDDAGNTEQQEDRKESEEKILYYVTDEKQQSQYINLFKEQHMEAYVLKHNIDVPFMQQLESKNEGVKFRRIDADLTAAFTSETSKEKEKEFEESATKIAEMMKKALGKDITVKVQKLKDPKVSSILTVSEESRRMQDMMKLYQLNGMNMGDFGAEGQTLYLNADHPLVQYVMGHLQEEVSEKLCQQLYDLAKLQNAPLSAEEMTAFLARSNELMMLTLPKTE